MEHKPYRKQHRGSIVWPLILILVGVLYLLANMGIIDPIATQSIWRLWPLIFFAIGFDSLIRRKEIAGPVFMFGLGAVFLLSNFGWLAWPAWDTLWRLWPIMVIAIGVDIMLGRRHLWLSILGVLAIFAMLFGLVWMLGGGLPALGGQPLPGEAIYQELGTAQAAEISLSPATGLLNLSASEDDAALIEGEVNMTNPNDVRGDYQLHDGVAVYSLSSHSTAALPGSARGWTLALHAQTPLNLDASMGAGQMNLDASELQLENLDASQGVGELSLSLPAGVALQADVSQAIGKITIQVPHDVAVRIEISKALSALNVPSAFELRDGYYYSPGYENADYVVDLNISQAIGNIEIIAGK
ncbi:MAG: hypothetical protein HN413_08785 [Chloroflexi bacterium]|jgi:hypothetical protein|nr:hypothetical protein [Chloroflexota bacterium]